MLADLKTMLVLNPHAGRGRGRKIFPEVLAILKTSFPTWRSGSLNTPVTLSRSAARPPRRLRTDLHRRRRRHSVRDRQRPVRRGAAAPGDLELGMIPAGTGNSFLRDFSTFSWRQALDGILAGKKRRVDLVEIHYERGQKEVRQYYLNILGVGLIADILKLTNEKLKGFGSLGYSLAVLLRLAKGMHNRLLLTVDGEKLEIADSALVISNSKYTGGGMKIAPMADTQDGKVDLVVFPGGQSSRHPEHLRPRLQGHPRRPPQGQDLSRRRGRHRQLPPGAAHGRRRAVGPHAAAPEGLARRAGHPGMKKSRRADAFPADLGRGLGLVFSRGALPAVDWRYFAPEVFLNPG